MDGFSILKTVCSLGVLEDNLGLDGFSILKTVCSLGVLEDNPGLDGFSILITVCSPVFLAGVGVYLPIRYRCSKYLVDMAFTICAVDDHA